MTERPLVIAHRGASGELAENTVPAFERAIKLGADFVEFDVRLGHDGDLVVSHNRIRSPDPGLARLDDVLETCAGRVGMAVEIKEMRATEPTLSALEKLRLDDESLIVVSFLPRVILRTRRRRPGVRTIQHVDYFPLRAAARFAWACGIREGPGADRAIAAARRLGLPATVYTVNDEARMRELCHLGVAGIFTDRPEILRSVVAG